MNWYRLYKFAEMPYGYWVTPDGEAKEVDNQSHESAAMSMGFDGYQGAFEAGYVRVAMPQRNQGFVYYFYIQAPSQGITYEQLSTLQGLTRDAQQFFRLSNISEQNAYNIEVGGTWQRLGSPQQVGQVLASHITQHSPQKEQVPVGTNTEQFDSPLAKA